jgi:uncharacterized membrane protein
LARAEQIKLSVLHHLLALFLIISLVLAAATVLAQEATGRVTLAQRKWVDLAVAALTLLRAVVVSKETQAAQVSVVRAQAAAVAAVAQLAQMVPRWLAAQVAQDLTQAHSVAK